MEKQKIVKSAQNDQDVIAFAQNEQEALVQVYFVRNGKLIGREHFRMEHIEDQNAEEIMTAFVKQFYSGTPIYPQGTDITEQSDRSPYYRNLAIG